MEDNTCEISFEIIDNKIICNDSDTDEFTRHDNPCVGINIETPLIDSIKDGDEFVIKSNEITIELDYPLSKTFIFPLISDNDNGFTRKELVSKISKLYHWIYKKEEETSEIRPTLRKESYNRNTTNGYFGIWGHVLSDLDIITVKYISSRNNYYVHVDS